MAGFYVYCRYWDGFSHSFPWFDELNPLPDDELLRELKRRIYDWFHANKGTLREKYRSKRKQVEDDWERYSKRSLPRPAPRLASLNKLEMIELFRQFDHKALVDLLEANDLQIAGTDEELRARYLAFYEREYETSELKRQRAQFRRDIAWSRNRTRPDVRKLLRGKRKGIPFEIRVARLAGWFFNETSQFLGMSPTPQLFMGRLESEEAVHHVIDAFWARMNELGHNDLMLRFGYVAETTLGVGRVASIDLELGSLADRKDGWNGTPIHQGIRKIYLQVASAVQEVQSRQDPPTPSASGMAEVVPDLPIWDSDRRELRFRGKVCKHYRKSPAPNQTSILDSFQKAGWPDKIAHLRDADGDALSQERLRETIRAMKKNLRMVTFRSDGTGSGVIWEPVVKRPRQSRRS